MRTKCFILLLALLCTSCAGPLVLSSRRCKGSGLWTTPKGEPKSSLNMKVWTGIQGKTLELGDILEKNKMKCEDVGGLQMQVTQTTSDFFISLIPFVSRKDLTLNFYNRPVIKEEEGVSADN